MAPKSTRTTGNDPIEGADPGGTHSTRPGTAVPGKPGTRQSEQHVVSGDENTDPPRRPGHQPEE